MHGCMRILRCNALPLQGQDIQIKQLTSGWRSLIVPGGGLSLRPDAFCTLKSLSGGLKPDLVTYRLGNSQDTVEKSCETATTRGINNLVNLSPAPYLLRRVYMMIMFLIFNENKATMLIGWPLEDLNEAARWASVTDHLL